MLTKTEIKVALEKFAADPLADEALTSVAYKYLGDSLSRITSYLRQPNAEIEVKDLGRIVVWLKSNWEGLDSTQKTRARNRLQALRTGGTDGVRAYLDQVMRRYASIGDDVGTAMNRLGVILALRAKDVDAQELQDLLNRASAV